jgi:hypothetical protein
VRSGKTAPSPEGDGYAAYNSIDRYTTDYIRVMNLSAYSDVRNAVGVEDTVKALAASPYAGSHYGGGKTLLDVIRRDKLINYDSVPIAGTVKVSGLNLSLPDINSMSQGDILKAAAVGVAVLAVVAATGNK